MLRVLRVLRGGGPLASGEGIDALRGVKRWAINHEVHAETRRLEGNKERY